MDVFLKSTHSKEAVICIWFGVVEFSIVSLRNHHFIYNYITLPGNSIWVLRDLHVPSAKFQDLEKALFLRRYTGLRLH